MKAPLNLPMLAMNVSEVKCTERANEKAKLKEKSSFLKIREIRDAQSLLSFKNELF